VRFASRMVAKRAPKGIAQVEHEGQMLHAYKRDDGLVSVVACDKDYPLRVSVEMMKKLLTAFDAMHRYVRGCCGSGGAVTRRLGC
jgi:hypothetical protein